MSVKRITRRVKSIKVDGDKFEVIFEVHYPPCPGCAERVEYKAVGEICQCTYTDDHGKPHKTKCTSFVSFYVRENFTEGRFILARSRGQHYSFVNKKVLEHIGIDYNKGQF